ncbi:MAG: hypothetical protein OEQ53_20070, partial [Saprospiraceae bacterium]|nr:hypothetical protein [Saprospiraceae bacterium]
MNYNIDNYEQFALDYLEGAMGDQESEEFEAFLLAHPDIYNELSQLRMVYAKPDLSVKYSRKDQLLKKSQAAQFSFNRIYTIAAAILLLIFSLVFLLPSDLPPSPEIVYNEQEIEPADVDDNPIRESQMEIESMAVQDNS